MEAVLHHKKNHIENHIPLKASFQTIKKPYFQPYQNHIETITKSYRNHKRNKAANNFSSPNDNSQT